MVEPPTPRPSQQRGRSSAALWLNLAVIYVVWGSTYFGIAIAIESIPPFLMATMRFAVAGLVLVAFDLWRHPGARRRPARRELIDAAIVGGLLLGIGNGFVALGETTVPSGIAAILVAMTPLWLALLGWLFLRQRLPRLIVGAIGLGFVGTAVLVWPTGSGATVFDPGGVLVLLLADLAWAVGSIYAAGRARLPTSPLTASGLQTLAGGAFTLVEAIAVGEPSRFAPSAVTLDSILALAYLVVFGSILAYTAYAWLLRHGQLSVASTHAYVNPVVAVVLGTVFLQEPLSARTVVAAAIILLAVAIIVTARGELGLGEAAESTGTAEPAGTA